MIQDIAELFSCNLVDVLIENAQIEWMMQPIYFAFWPVAEDPIAILDDGSLR